MMKPVNMRDSFRLGFRGEFEIVLADENGVKDRYRGHNLICDSAVDIILGLFSRDLDGKMISKISVGTGGDLDPDTHMDTGARVGPREDEEHMRQSIFDCPIANVESDLINHEIVFTAVAKQEEANSAVINEFGLLSEDGTMLAHFVTEADPLTGRAKRYNKTPLLYMVVRWTIYPTVVRT
jgi:hypothetical protein